jgi:hypothetical protein
MVTTRADVAAFEQRIVDMFRSEWRRSRLSSARPLNRIAIVDYGPRSAIPLPRVLLFQQLFERHGLRAVILRQPRARRAAARSVYGTADVCRAAAMQTCMGDSDSDSGKATRKMPLCRFFAG